MLLIYVHLNFSYFGVAVIDLILIYHVEIWIK